MPPDSPRPARNRWHHAVATLFVIGLGLASRRFTWLFPAELGKYPGDALWALMVFMAMAVVWPRASTARLAVAALALSFAVEFSQLYQAPWIDAVRSTTLGHLALGSGFGWVDLVAYAVGVATGALADSVQAGQRVSA